MTFKINQHNDQFHIEGDIGFSNVEACLKALQTVLNAHQNSPLQLNFAQVKHLDGSIVALMISLLRSARSLGIKVSYLRVPDHILRISELYGVRSMLPIEV